MQAQILLYKVVILFALVFKIMYAETVNTLYLYHLIFCITMCSYILISAESVSVFVHEYMQMGENRWVKQMGETMKFLSN